MAVDRNGASYQAGLNTRKEVLGAEWVEAAMSRATDFNIPMQDILNEYCWGFCWNREGLERKIRSLLNIAMLAGTGPAHELKGHVRGALRNGATRTEIAETLVQVAIYRGVPNAADGFRVATEALNEYDAEQAAAGTDGAQS